MHAIKTKAHNFNWRSIKTKSRDNQLLNTKGHLELGKRQRILFIYVRAAIDSHSADVLYQNTSVKVSQFHPQFDDKCLHKLSCSFSVIKSVTFAATTLFSTISSQPRTWTSPHCMLFYGGGGGKEGEKGGGGGYVWVTAEAVYQLPWTWMTEMRWDGRTSKLLLELCTLPSLSSPPLPLPVGSIA